VTVEFHESGGSTQLVLTGQGVYFDGHDTAAQREEGTRYLLDSLAAALAGGDA
jgi:Activator of Hsp90 ATPase homolog 1-like protein